MAQLQIKDLPQEYLTAWKVTAAANGLTLKQFVIAALEAARLTVTPLPPATVGGTIGEGAQQLATGNTPSPRHSSKR